ncbi:SGNH/GDSL hydrolase family protein [Microbacterium sp. GXF7504]
MASKSSIWRHRDGRLKPLSIGVIAVATVAVVGVATGVALSVGNDGGTANPAASYTPRSEYSFNQPDEATEAAAFQPVVASYGRARPVALLLGDSYSAGVGATDPEEGGYAALLADDLGWDIIVMSAPGGGYALPGINGESLPQMLAGADLDSIAPDIVLIQSGYNDASAQDEDVRRAIREMQEFISARLPGTPVVVVGEFWPGEPTPSSTARAATIQQAWANQPNTLVLDPIASGWSSFATTDDRHPDDAGHALIAQQITEAMRAAGLI